MKTAQRLTLRFLTLGVIAALLSGCLLSAPSLDPVRHDMEARLPGVTLDPGIQMRLGRLSLGMAKGIVRMAMDEEDEEEVFAMLRHVKGMEVAIYETDTLTADGPQRWANYLSDLGARRGWVPVAKVHEGDSSSVVFFKHKRDQIRGVYVFTLNEENMVMARFKGRLDRVVAEALALHGDEIAAGIAKGEGGGTTDDDAIGDDENGLEEPESTSSTVATDPTTFER